MSGKVKIMGVQFTPEIGNKVSNFLKISKIINENSWFNPDLIVLPEVFNTGLGFDNVEMDAETIPIDQTTMFLSGFAEKFNANIVGGSFIERCPDGKLRNTSLVLDRSGKIIGKYSKIHMFSYYGSDEGKYITTGDSAVIVETDFGKIGLSICYDLRFPELYRKLAFEGAELIVCPAAWPYPRFDHWMTLNKARAIENLTYMVSVNQVGNTQSSRINAGHSMVINPWGEVIASAGSNEGAMLAEIDLSQVQKTRNEFPVLNDRNLTAYENLKQYYTDLNK